MSEGNSRGRPRVAIIGWRFQNAGNSVGQFLIEASERYDVTFISREVDPEFRRSANWWRVPVPRRGVRLRWPLQFTLSTLRRIGLNADLTHSMGPLPAAGGHFDLATLNFSLTGLYAAAAGRIPGQPPLLWRPLQGLGRATERYAYSPRRAGMLAGVSASQGRELERHFPGVPVAVTRRGLETPRFGPDRNDGRAWRSEHGIDEQELVAILVARPERYKGLPETLEALSRMRVAGEPAPLLLVAGALKPWIERLVSAHGLGERVRLLGHRNDIARCLRAADIFVLPTLYETFCLAAHEAAATELPVVATLVHGVDELIGDGGAGIAISRDPDSIAAALVKLGCDPELRARLGAEGRRRCLARPADEFVTSTLALYEELLSGIRSVSSSSRSIAAAASPGPNR